jgi:hypothetical protein
VVSGRWSVVREEKTEGDSQNGIESLVLRYALLDSLDSRATAPEAVVGGATRACRREAGLRVSVA